jgi:hypothetical protein
LATFYVNCIREVTKIEKHADKGEKKFDLQAASDLCRDYKKKVCDAFLKLRQHMW